MSASSSHPTIKHILVRHRDPSWTEPNGALVIPDSFDDWSEVPFVSVNGCPHETTVCDECFPSWDADYALQFVFDTGEVVSIDELRRRLIDDTDDKENPDGG